MRVEARAFASGLKPGFLLTRPKICKNMQNNLSGVLLLFDYLVGKCVSIIGLKAPGDYYASIWSDNFSMCLWENLKFLISMISGLVDMSPSPNTN